jgi:P27 family predicted phage terminase small subunit
MGSRGPARTPTKVLQLRGTYRKDRHGDPAGEPEFELVTEMPPPPGFLDEMAAFEWHRVGPELIEKQLLTVADMAAFTLYCINVSRVVACEREIAKDGLTIETPQGFLQAHPMISVGRQAGAEVRKFAQEFGLTPSARSRVKATPAPKSGEEKPDDPWGKLAGGAS